MQVPSSEGDAVEQLPRRIDGHRDVVADASRISVWRVTGSARKVVRFAANEPRAWREEGLARHAGEGIDKRGGPKATDRLQFLGEKPSLFLRGRSRLLPPLAPGFRRCV